MRNFLPSMAACSRWRRHRLFGFVLLSTVSTPAAGCGDEGESSGKETTGQSDDPPLGFFVTSRGLGAGGDLGGIAGADAHCAVLAESVGAGGRQWRAYLSTQGEGAQSARERIGLGPWHNAAGELVASDLEALHAEMNLVDAATALDEHGQRVNGWGDEPNEHDILTGTRPDGLHVEVSGDRTCSNWTSSEQGVGQARIGHHDRLGQGDLPFSWNSAHGTVGCSQGDFEFTGGSGKFYCFAADPAAG